jgi:hypothetical protein
VSFNNGITADDIEALANDPATAVRSTTEHEAPGATAPDAPRQSRSNRLADSAEQDAVEAKLEASRKASPFETTTIDSRAPMPPRQRSGYIPPWKKPKPAPPIKTREPDQMLERIESAPYSAVFHLAPKVIVEAKQAAIDAVGAYRDSQGPAQSLLADKAAEDDLYRRAVEGALVKGEDIPAHLATDWVTEGVRRNAALAVARDAANEAIDAYERSIRENLEEWRQACIAKVGPAHTKALKAARALVEALDVFTKTKSAAHQMSVQVGAFSPSWHASPNKLRITSLDGVRAALEYLEAPDPMTTGQYLSEPEEIDKSGLPKVPEHTIENLRKRAAAGSSADADLLWLISQAYEDIHNASVDQMRELLRQRSIAFGLSK